jgi:hypothetical protein
VDVKAGFGSKRRVLGVLRRMLRKSLMCSAGAGDRLWPFPDIRERQVNSGLIRV